MDNIVDIDDYRKSRGTKGNFSILMIASRKGIMRMSNEAIGSYKNIDEFMKLFNELVENMMTDKQFGAQIGSSAYYEIEIQGPDNNVLSANLNITGFDLSTPVSLLINVRVYTRNQKELQEIERLMIQTYNKFRILKINAEDVGSSILV